MDVVLHDPKRSLRAQALVVGTRPAGSGVALAAGADVAEPLLGGHLIDALTALSATGAKDEVVKIATVGHSDVPLVVAVGLGPDDCAESTRRAAGAAVRALSGVRNVAISLGTQPETVGAVAEGALLGGYRFDTYRTAEQPAAPETVHVIAGRDPANRAALARAEAVAAATALARDLVNTPANDLYPETFAARVAAAGKEAGLDVEVLDEAALAAGGYGGILAVGGGSARPPRLVRLTYRPRRARATVALIGKGITYDSGGINLKSPAPVEMKGDMAGAAAVVAATVAAARLKLSVAVTATVPMAENMPSGSSYRPSDVVRMRGGRTVEVVNTDAEGRMILADAIVRAAEDGPDHLIETSTLTGAQVVALGERTAGVMGSRDMQDLLAAAGDSVGETMWPMPLPEELAAELRSDVADLKHVSGKRAAGMLIAGQFLSEFVPDGLPWAHIDVAGPAGLVSTPSGYLPKGATGAPTRTLVAALERLADG
jgi:leucyl aminopeptidase